MPNLLQQEISQRSTNCRNRSRDYAGHSIWVLTEERDIEEWELVSGVTECASKHRADDDAEWPTDRIDWQDGSLVRRIGKFSKDAVNDRNVSCSRLRHCSVGPRRKKSVTDQRRSHVGFL